MLGVNVDVTERKQAEELRSNMTRKLIESQEHERARIARELHDDIGQRVAMLAIEIERLERRPEAPSEIRNTAREISQRIKELSTDIQALSHELHSSKLEYLGIVGGMKSWCREIGERHGMQIEFKHSGSLSSLPSQTSTCLFRVLQEALHNSAKHSGVKSVDVQLRAEPGEVQLIVHDRGKGFDVAAAMQGRGLGITSMLERVRLLGGTVTIDSKPRGGTTVYACIPLEAHQTQQAGS
jgi:signal transduction histidine kinase